MAQTYRCNWKFSDWAAYLGDKYDRPVPKKFGSPRSTRIVRLNDHAIAVKYHHTNVVIFHSDETVEINTGGWYTVTTKHRINTFAPVTIYQQNHAWYYNNGLPFKDGQRFYPDGTRFVPAPEKSEITSHSEIQAAPFYVVCNDTVMSGWGYARNKINTLILACESFDLAEIVAENARNRGDQRHIRIYVGKKPPLSLDTHIYNHHNRDDYDRWYKRGGF